MSEMTGDEQRWKLARAMRDAAMRREEGISVPAMLDALDAVGAAGFFLVTENDAKQALAASGGNEQDFMSCLRKVKLPLAETS